MDLLMKRFRGAALALTIATASLTIAVASLGGPASAQAPPQATTHWFTIDVVQPQPQSRVLFLAEGTRSRGVQSAPVVMKGYVSGDASMQWTPVLRDYPLLPAVQGGGPSLDDVVGFFEDCFAPPPCGFHVNIPPIKMVNRKTGLCISVAPWIRGAKGTPLIVDDCGSVAPGAQQERQILDPVLASQSTSNPYSTVAVKRGAVQLCADVNGGNSHDHRRSPGSPLSVWPCDGGTNQRFRFLPVDQVTCPVANPYRLQVCGITTGDHRS